MSGPDGWMWEPEEEPQRTRPAGEAFRAAMSTAGSVLLALGLVTLTVLAWPHQLGGRFGTTVVVGHSMDGTYRTGDVVITMSDEVYHPGEVIVYTVSYAEAKGTVVHRIVDEQDGTFTTRGDNNPYPDPWPVTDDDVRGAVVLRIPVIGWGLLLVRTPLALMLLTGALVTYLLWPRERNDDEAPPRGEAAALTPPSEPPGPADTPTA